MEPGGTAIGTNRAILFLLAGRRGRSVGRASRATFPLSLQVSPATVVISTASRARSLPPAPRDAPILFLIGPAGPARRFLSVRPGRYRAPAIFFPSPRGGILIGARHRSPSGTRSGSVRSSRPVISRPSVAANYLSVRTQRDGASAATLCKFAAICSRGVCNMRRVLTSR